MDNNTINTYNSIAKKYKENFENDMSEKKYYDIFLEKINGNKILDVGCGIGTFTNYVSEKGYDILGIDSSIEMLNIAKKNFPNVLFKEVNMTNITLKKLFDGIICANSLFHIQKNEVVNVLHKFNNLLQPDGKIMFILLEGTGEGFEQEPLNPNLSIFVNYYSLEDFIEILKNIGFDTIYKNIELNKKYGELGNSKMIIIAKKYNNQNGQSALPGGIER